MNIGVCKFFFQEGIIDFVSYETVTVSCIDRQVAFSFKVCEFCENVRIFRKFSQAVKLSQKSHPFFGIH